MAERNSIQAELRRRVLVEAGHRCAIHTCRNPDVDVHHIVPWETCREHSYDNLIALCPNCHRRATNGVIDRKSLRLYKAHLIAALGSQTVDSMPGVKTNARQRWLTSLIEDRQSAPVAYEISIEFPQFLPDQGELAELNVIQQASALARVLDYRRHRLRAPQGSALPSDEYWESFEVFLFTDAFISIKHSLSEYCAGAAHPNHFTMTNNYQRDPLIPLELEDLFVDDGAAVSKISTYCETDLVRQKQLAQPDDSIIFGSGPHAKNFQAFNVLPSGLLITFDPYRVGAYAEGFFQVLVPKHELALLLSPRTRLKAMWT